MNVIWFLVIGGLAGWIAGSLARGRGFGFWGNIIVGMLGAVVGGFLLDLLQVGAYGFLGRLAMAVVGALVLLILASLVRRK